MAGSINKVILVGNVGNDPEIKTMQSGDRVANLSIATSETWKDKNSGERKEKTEWHRVVVFNQNLVNVVENYIKKGAKLYVEGQLETRSYENKDGQKVYTTEIVLKAFRGEITMLDSKGSSAGGFASQGQDDYGSAGFGGGSSSPSRSSSQSRAPIDELENEIPF
ncbi:MAG: single-stranded DNA-binding protein [Micavibrio aeruginosavorus]|uniref:Single-stranded DNA-binding protein n=1 Tax=Micavibrio aeruginosavorus TaxID=349221 RepID=A0A2W5BWS8_9BACT|nr:MAG: single-stranded DNA-binding protein [Micavibrio aeruginosavorus]